MAMAIEDHNGYGTVVEKIYEGVSERLVTGRDSAIK